MGAVTVDLVFRQTHHILHVLHSSSRIDDTVQLTSLNQRHDLRLDIVDQLVVHLHLAQTEEINMILIPLRTITGAAVG